MSEVAKSLESKQVEVETKDILVAAPLVSENKTSLLEACVLMRKAISDFSLLSERSQNIAVNSAIEGARLKAKLSAFEVVASQIHDQALTNADLCETLITLVSKLERIALHSTSVRYYELAEDLIDKLDRNLFERNCDCQAWATFEATVDCATAAKDWDAAKVFESHAAHPAFQSASQLLERLMTTYVVYSDIFLLNKRGIVLAAAKNQSSISQEWGQKDWFQAAVSGEVHVSDMQFSKETSGYAVYYSAPVKDSSGDIVGVVSTRFNWEFAQEMIESAMYEPDVQAYFLNREGEVIGSTDKIGTLKDHMHWLDAGRMTMKGNCGFTVEHLRNGLLASVGFARTKGYNSYRGKKWSTLLSHRLGNLNLPHLDHIVDQRSDSVPLGTRYTETGKAIESELANQNLLSVVQDIRKHLSTVNANNREVGLLAINASVQSGRAGPDGDSFSVIANHIGRLAKSSLKFVESVNHAAEALSGAVETTVLNRLKDAAQDAVDKVDRNLFERYCDVQAWTTFREFVDSCKTSRKSESTNELLAQLHKIYEVYHDILLLDAQGNIISSAVNRNLIGSNQGSRQWFKEAVSGRVNFTDVYSSASVKAPTVAFSAPIMDGSRVIGVLSTRFNCNFLNDILKAVIAPAKAKVSLVNVKGQVISSVVPEEILSKSFAHLKAFKGLAQSPMGSLIEKDSTDQKDYAVGYSTSKGYNTYPGKGWSILIRLPKE